jgi:hypothetical protein
MPDRIIHKRSLTANSIPAISSLEIGEIALNVNDGKLFFRQSGSVGDITVSPIMPDQTSSMAVASAVTAQTADNANSLAGVGAAEYALKSGDPIEFGNRVTFGQPVIFNDQVDFNGPVNGVVTTSQSGSFLTTASVNLNTITFTKGDGSNFAVTVNTGSGGGGGTGTGFPFTGNAIITGSLLVSGSGVTITGSLNMFGPIIVPFNTQTSNYTLQLSDAGDIVEINSGSANTVTIPSSSVTNFIIGTQITVVQYGTGQTTFTTGSTNVLLRSAGNATKLAAQYAGATLIKRGTDEWYLLGNVTV